MGNIRALRAERRRLTPIRMLVNGGSIAYDRQKRRFTYYHIEVANHAILQAENLGMESYLPAAMPVCLKTDTMSLSSSR